MLFPHVTPYSEEVKKLLTPEGFEAAFWRLYGSSEWKNREECYEVLESEFEHLFGRRKYSEYKYFTDCLYRRHKQRKKGR